MATIADYLVLNDAPIQLSVLLEPPSTPGPQSKFFRFDLPDDFVVGTNLAKPVLLFRVQALDDSRIDVHVNDSDSGGTTSSGFPTNPDYFAQLPKGYSGLQMETISGNRFKKGQRNEIVIRIAGDAHSRFGDVILGDVVLLIQRERD